MRGAEYTQLDHRTPDWPAQLLAKLYLNAFKIIFDYAERGSENQKVYKSEDGIVNL